MAFARIDKPQPKPLAIRFSRRANDAISFKMSAGLYESIGEPRAIHFEWDDENSLIRVVADSPDAAGTYRIRANGEYTVTDLIASIGVHFSETQSVPAVSDGPTAAIANLTEYRSR